MLLEFGHAETGLAVVLDDDGRVAWAYLRAPEGDIIGDVWLYNRAPGPHAPDWSDPKQAPFPNPLDHARPLDRPLPSSPADLSVRWTLDGPLLLADVHLHGALLARLSPGSAPGWNVLVLLDGPCAQRLPFPDEGEG